MRLALVFIMLVVFIGSASASTCSNVENNVCNLPDSNVSRTYTFIGDNVTENYLANNTVLTEINIFSSIDMPPKTLSWDGWVPVYESLPITVRYTWELGDRFGNIITIYETHVVQKGTLYTTEDTSYEVKSGNKNSSINYDVYKEDFGEEFPEKIVSMDRVYNIVIGDRFYVTSNIKIGDRITFISGMTSNKILTSSTNSAYILPKGSSKFAVTSLTIPPNRNRYPTLNYNILSVELKITSKSFYDAGIQISEDIAAMNAVFRVFVAMYQLILKVYQATANAAALFGIGEGFSEAEYFNALNDLIEPLKFLNYGIMGIFWVITFITAIGIIAFAAIVEMIIFIAAYARSGDMMGAFANFISYSTAFWSKYVFGPVVWIFEKLISITR